MLNIKELQKLMDDINFSWVDNEILINVGEDGRMEVRSVRSFPVIFILLAEILSELKQLNGTSQ